MSRVRLSRRRTVDAGPAPGLTPDRVWGAISKVSFAVLNYVTPAGEPRSSGVGWGGVRHGGAAPLRRDCPRQLEGAPHLGRRPGRRDPADPRGGLLSLVAPIPPATVSCHAKWPPAGGKPADHPYRFSIRPARR